VSEAVLPLTTIGKTTPRVDAIERVTGQAKYTNDIKLPGMLYARVLRSPHPHARLLRIDTSAASRLPGVQAVITHETAHVVWGAGAVRRGCGAAWLRLWTVALWARAAGVGRIAHGFAPALKRSL